MTFQILKAEPSENHLFYQLDGEAAQRHGAIGYLRGDYGRSGDEFHTSWFDNQKHLKSETFCEDFNHVIDFLRFASLDPSYHDDSFTGECLMNMRFRVTDTGSRFKIATEQFTFYVRSFSRYGTDYDLYVFAYDSYYLLPELAGQHELPELCYSTLPLDGSVITINRYEKGYRQFSSPITDRTINREFVNAANERLDVTPAQEQAMFAGSMFGWQTPAAKPWNYHADGTLRPLPPTKKEQERQ